MQGIDAVPVLPTLPVGVKVSISLLDGRVKISAAWLIENSGIHKGDEIGGARISTKHVLALTNSGSATASEIAELARRAKDQVQNQFGINLETEVNLVGIEI